MSKPLPTEMLIEEFQKTIQDIWLPAIENKLVVQVTNRVLKNAEERMLDILIERTNLEVRVHQIIRDAVDRRIDEILDVLRRNE